MWTALWGALIDKLLGFIEAWQLRRERDKRVEEETQDDARIADQAAALDALRRAADVPERVPVDQRRGRRPSASASE